MSLQSNSWTVPFVSALVKQFLLFVSSYVFPVWILLILPVWGTNFSLFGPYSYSCQDHIKFYRSKSRQFFIVWVQLIALGRIILNYICLGHPSFCGLYRTHLFCLCRPDFFIMIIIFQLGSAEQTSLNGNAKASLSVSQARQAVTNLGATAATSLADGMPASSPLVSLSPGITA